MERHSVRHPRDKKEIGSPLSGGATIVGEHEIIFAGHDEIMEIRHTALSREIFARGPWRPPSLWPPSRSPVCTT